MVVWAAGGAVASAASGDLPGPDGYNGLAAGTAREERQRGDLEGGPQEHVEIGQDRGGPAGGLDIASGGRLRCSGQRSTQTHDLEVQADGEALAKMVGGVGGGIY